MAKGPLNLATLDHPKQNVRFEWPELQNCWRPLGSHIGFAEPRSPKWIKRQGFSPTMGDSGRSGILPHLLATRRINWQRPMTWVNGLLMLKLVSSDQLPGPTSCQLILVMNLR